ncbi:glycosyltransferase family 4 protein [Marinomonas epiphytica]
MPKLRIDPSWEGKGGIGRFYSEVSSRLTKAHKLKKVKSPASPLVTFFYAFQSLFYSSKDIFLYFGYIPPFFSKQKFYFVIYDLNHLDVPYNSSLIKRLFYRLVIKPGCFKAEKIFTISEFSKRRIVEWSGVRESKVVNVGCGVSDIFYKNEKAYEPGYEYIFCPSNRKKHKNEERLIRAFHEVSKKVDIHLIFTGLVTSELDELIKQHDIADRVHFFGYATEQQLAELYKGARLMAFPSLYEGFGLPVLEAVASGTPVLSSNTTALSEISMGLVSFVTPHDFKSIEEKIMEILVTQEERPANPPEFNCSWEVVSFLIEKVIKQ